MTEISQLSAWELREGLRDGTHSSLELVEHFLAQIDAQNPSLGSFLLVTHEQARADARAADLLRQQGAALPNLHGLPLAYKDLTDVAGVPTTLGTAALPPSTPEADDPLVARLRSAGTISLGKTQVPEFGLSSYSENLIAPPSRNPLDHTRSSGGSSGGAAAAVAAGMLPFSPGSDGGGSVRIPASACGLIGLKPGLGAVPSDVHEGNTDAFGAPRLTTSGPLARTALDAALLYDAMRGDPEELSLRAVQASQDLRGLSIGVSTRSPFEGWTEIQLSQEAEQALAVGTARLTEAGHRTQEANLLYDPRYPWAFTTLWTSALGLIPFPEPALDSLGTLARSFYERATARDRSETTSAVTALAEISADMRTQWSAYDVVLTPAMAFLPPTVGSLIRQDAETDYRMQCQYTPFTSMVNVTGLPAVTVPTLTTPAGLSMGVQLIGRPGSEAQLLALAAQIAERPLR